MSNTRKSLNRTDYTPYPYLINSVALSLALEPTRTRVNSRFTAVRRAGETCTTMVLDAVKMQIVSLMLDGKTLHEGADYTYADDQLTLKNVPATFTLETEVIINPSENKTASGLYMDGEGDTATFITQCESQGFRRITPWPDRPDVLTKFSVTVSAPKARYPVLLSNGNKVQEVEDTNGCHAVTWEDPNPKPSYLFAIVGGNFGVLEDTFTTMSGRTVALKIWAPQNKLSRVAFSMECLKKAMRWDEVAYGREYDLDIFQIVGTDTFNAGAMENTSLNIFNNSLLEGDKDTATDTRLGLIDAVIAHEFFHHWTGNHVTVRSWFELTLKEGLTVFRDQSYSSDHGSAVVQRIKQVQDLKARQYPEDSSPMAHPIRPDVVESIDNFYTMTVYEKGAEIIRMYRTLLGAEGYRKGTDLYFKRHDGSAVTCDDFRAAMADANGKSLEHFGLWYQQSGTPKVFVTSVYDAKNSTYTLTFKQENPNGRHGNKPMHIPIKLGLMNGDGNDMPLQVKENHTFADGWQAFDAETGVVHLKQTEQSITFVGITEEPVPSLLREFSAPVELVYAYSTDDLLYLMRHDTDGFNRYEAAQKLYLQEILRLISADEKGKKLVLDDAIIDTVNAVLSDNALDNAIKAEMLSLPSKEYVMEQFSTIPLDAFLKVYRFVKSRIAQACQSALMGTYTTLHTGKAYAYTGAGIADRALKNTCLSYLLALKEADLYDMAAAQLETADNFTDLLAGFTGLAGAEGEGAEDLFVMAKNAFELAYGNDTLCMDTYFSVLAGADNDDALKTARALEKHPAFKADNPNKLRALFGAFGKNLRAFHKADGSGYDYLAEKIMAVDAFNPQVASRLCAPFLKWQRFDAGRQAGMRTAMERIIAREGCSANVAEVLGKALAEKNEKAA